MLTGSLDCCSNKILQIIFIRYKQVVQYEGAVDQNGNNIEFARTVKSYFKDGDVARQGTKEDGTMMYELTENGKPKYEAYEGDVVFDYRTGKLFKKQGTMLR